MNDSSAPDGRKRLSPMTPASLTPSQRQLYDAILNSPRGTIAADDGHLPGPFNAMLLSPALGGALQALGSAIRFASSLVPRTLELAILAVASASRSEYEWSRHSRIAVRLGVTEPELNAIRAFEDLPSPADPTEELVITVTRKLLADGDLSDADYFEAAAQLGHRVVFEISTVVGYYKLIALQLRLFRVPVD